MPWLTPDDLPTDKRCRRLLIPDNLDIVAAVTGALVSLTHAYNWEQFGSITPDEMAQAMIEMLAYYWADCDPSMTMPVIFADQKAQNTAGGGATSGSWQTRTLNQIGDADSIGASLLNNEFTLPTGRWLIEWRAPAYLVNGHKSRLFSVTENQAIAYGSSERAAPAGAAVTWSEGLAIQGNSSPTTYRIEHRVATSVATNGYGFPTNLEVEQYTLVKCSLIPPPS
jgi:hypothetical protein